MEDSKVLDVPWWSQLGLRESKDLADAVLDQITAKRQLTPAILSSMTKDELIDCIITGSYASLRHKTADDLCIDKIQMIKRIKKDLPGLLADLMLCPVAK
jgi:hypothetical protein